MSNRFRNQNDYKLVELTLVNFSGEERSISDYMVGLDFSEDIFQSFIFGTLRMRDSIDLVQYFPIIGEETLRFGYVTDDDLQETVYREFRIYNVSGRGERDNSYKEYTLSFCSPEVLEDQNTTITKSYKGILPGKIVEDVCTRYLETNKNITIDETKNPIHIIVPNWSPGQLLNWVAGQSFHATYKANGMFFFYENKNGLNFSHIETLINKESIGTYTTKISSVDRNQTGKDEPTYPVKNVITSYSIASNNDTLSSMSDGMYGTRVISYDSLTKQIKINDFSYEDEFKNLSHLGSSKLNSSYFGKRNPRQRIVMSPTRYLGDSSWYNQTEEIDYGRKGEEISFYKSSYLSQIMSNKINLETPGNSDLTVGEVIDIILPNQTEIESMKTKSGDRFVGGKVLVTKCQHSFTPQSYKQKMLVVKDSVDNEHQYMLG